MKHRELDAVVLARDLSGYDLRTGDLGAVVGVYDPDGVKVEFVAATGKTEVALMLTEHDIRPVDQGDLIAVRPLNHAAQRYSTTYQHICSAAVWQ